MRVTRTLDAEGIPTCEVSNTGGDGTRTHTIITQQEAQGVILGALNDPSRPDASGPLGTMGEDDLYDVNTDFAADLLKDGEGTVAQLIETYHPTSDSPIDVPVLEVDYNQFDLDESGSGPEARTSPDKEPVRSAVMTEDPNSDSRADAPQTGASEAGGPSSHQPSPQMGTLYIEITGAGSFRRESGQPVWLRAYPNVKPAPAPLTNRRPQAYRQQDRYNPVWTYVRGTRRDRLKALVEAWREAGSPTKNDRPTSEFEIRLYGGEERILQEPQPWVGEVGPGADYNRLEECDHLVMNAVKESGRLPWLEGGFDVATPSYLTVVLPSDKAMSTAREAIEIGVAFPYARGRHQML